ncbi:hypothetical protein PRIPAC_91969 [Pristionchus pacificus]|uniref:Uncharacterized protein n=1 Tax=Pristionchus pacificus TaxID=54126 RepID=A0A2A6CI98_PRIPA|nr:hypothetical protein PRIPAC_91969 [Pristionchus pacificus]|eukprot:PDM77783.1 hypothetical protein PRIPAC_34650 [Pristionchus pacificus]
MCFPSKRDHHPKERRRKKDGQHYNEQPLPPGVHGGQPGGPGDSGKEREEDPTVAEDRHCSEFVIANVLCTGSHARVRSGAVFLAATALHRRSAHVRRNVDRTTHPKHLTTTHSLNFYQSSN